MANEDLSTLAQRLDRIEQALARFSVLDDLINSTDPPPEDLGRVRSDLYRLLALMRRPPVGDPAASDLARLMRRPPVGDPAASDLARLMRRPPIGDPATTDLARLGRSVLEERLSEILVRNPGWFTDPPPDDFLNVRILDLIRRWRGGFTDPAPEDLANARLRDLLQRIPGGGITDPGPEDLARLTKPELETQLHKVSTEMVRLKSLERMLNERRSQLEKS